MSSLSEHQLDQLRQHTNQLNNYLQQISGYAQRCVSLVQTVPLAKNYLGNVVESANAAGDLAQSLLEALYNFDVVEEGAKPATGASPPTEPPVAKPAPVERAPKPPEIVVADSGSEEEPQETHMPPRGGPSPDDPVVRLRTADLPAVEDERPQQPSPEPKQQPVEQPRAKPATAAALPPDLPVENPTGEKEMIMLVDDDEHVLLLAKMILVEADYKIVMAQNGLEALQLYQKAASVIELVILDYAMPIMDGSEVFEELRLINPRAQVLLSSGFTEQSKLNQMLSKGLRGFLPKPYTREKMLLQVRSAIDSSR